MSMTPNGIARLRRLAVIAASTVAISSAAVSIVAWVDARYAKAGDLMQIQQDIKCLGRDVRLGQLQTRETLLVQEAAALEIARRQRTLTQLEVQRYNEVLAEHGRLLSDRRRLELDTTCR